MDSLVTAPPAGDRRESAIAGAMWLRLRDMGFTRPPIDSYRVAAHSGVEVVEWPLPSNLAGLLVPSPGHPRIYVNLRHPWSRRQFTVMHELVHAWFHEPAHCCPASLDRSAGDDLEREADAGAAAGKMPGHLVRNQVGLVGPDAPLLAHVFGVSRAAMTRRLAELGLAPARPARGGGRRRAGGG